MVQRGRLKGKGKDEIGVRVGKVVDKYKMHKHLVLDIRDGSFDFHIDDEKVAAETALDGIYVIRTSLDENQCSAEDMVRHYKRLVLIEQAYRSMKTIDLDVRRIRHHTEDRVRAHIFLCMLADGRWARACLLEAVRSDPRQLAHPRTWAAFVLSWLPRGSLRLLNPLASRLTGLNGVPVVSDVGPR